MNPRHVIALLAGLALAACSPAPPFRIRVETDSPLVKGQEDALLEQAKQATEFWGGNIDTLRGWEFTFVDPEAIAPSCGFTGAMGCTKVGDEQMFATVTFWTYEFDGPENTRLVLWHEIGHAVLAMLNFDGDADHHDPRWAQVAPTGAL